MGERLGRRFYRRDPVTLAKSLLGQILVRRLEDGTELSGRIVEVEAYLGVEDKACHSYGGRKTKRNASMYLDAGHAYVYFTYGMHWCFNVVSDREGVPTACLIRALEPLTGLNEMKRLRAGKIRARQLREQDLCSGPAKLTQALGIAGAQDGIDLAAGSEEMYVAPGGVSTRKRVESTPRIGVGYAREWAPRCLRFFLSGNPHVSAPPFKRERLRPR